MDFLNKLFGKKQQATSTNNQPSHSVQPPIAPVQKAKVPAVVNEIVHEGSGSTKLHLACNHGDVEQVRT
jgi:hypothetical protein